MRIFVDERMEVEKNMKLSEQIKIMEFPDFGDERGKLVVAESGVDISFEIKRAFYIYGSDLEVIRGRHANRKSEFVMINVSGKSKVKFDNGHEQKDIELNRPRKGLYLSIMIWKDMYDFSADSVLLVLTSVHYDAMQKSISRIIKNTSGRSQSHESAK